MRPEDERRDDASADEPVEPVEPEGQDPAGLPPATWAGRRRAGLEPESGAPDADQPEPAPDEPPPGADQPEPPDAIYDADEEALDPSATEEFDSLAADPGADREAAEEAESDQLDEWPEEGDLEQGERADDDVDAEEATDAALAGVRARAAEHDHRAEAATGEPGEAVAAEASGGAASEAAAPPPPGPGPPAGAEGKPPKAKRIWARFVAASLVIVIAMAAATSISLLVYLTDIAEGLGDNDALASLQDQLADVDGGSPQTILILGSDKRLHTKGDPGRSDTTLLLRVDPDKDRIALLSIPRDLKVNIPGYGVGKFNEAYTLKGPDLTTRVVKQLTGLEINHVVNINFTGFADAVNAIDCVYIDVDRNYYIAPESNIAEIDIQAGYQRLCGLKALQYVRFRHDDNDLVRSARQQDFLREARQKLPPGTLVRDRNELLDIFTEYTTSDIGEAVPLLELLKTFAAVQSAPVREVHFPADLGDGTSTYVTASDSAIKETVREFLDAEGTPGERPAGKADKQGKGEEPKDEKSGGSEKKSNDDHFEGPPMDDATAIGEDYGRRIEAEERKSGKPMVDFPIFYPTRLSPGSVLNEASRAFPIDGPGDDVYHGYKLVARFFGPGGYYEYYGVSGTDWVDAPILANPSETRTIDGRDYLLFYDGDRLRLVGWKTPKAAYWVNNTLLQALDEGEMLSIATSMRELGK